MFYKKLLDSITTSNYTAKIYDRSEYSEKTLLKASLIQTVHTAVTKVSTSIVPIVVTLDKTRTPTAQRLLCSSAGSETLSFLDYALPCSPYTSSYSTAPCTSSTKISAYYFRLLT